MANPNPSPETRFKPGHPKYGGAKPGAISLTAKLRQALESGEYSGIKLAKGETVADVFIRSIVKYALTGKYPYAKEILDRLEGKVAEKFEMSDARGVRDLAEEILAARKARAESNGKSDH